MCYIQDQKDFFLLQKKFLALYLIAANLSPTPKTPVELLLIFKRFGYVGIDFFKKEDKIAVLEGKSMKEHCLPSLVMDYLQCVLNMQV